MKWPLPIWPLYECAMLYMLGVVYSKVECAFSPIIKMGVLSIIPKCIICELSETLGYCKCVVILWREVPLITMLLPLCDHEDQYVHTHTPCITMSMIYLVCLLKG